MSVHKFSPDLEKYLSRNNIPFVCRKDRIYVLGKYDVLNPQELLADCVEEEKVVLGRILSSFVSFRDSGVMQYIMSLSCSDLFCPPPYVETLLKKQKITMEKENIHGYSVVEMNIKTKFEAAHYDIDSLKLMKKIIGSIFELEDLLRVLVHAYASNKLGVKLAKQKEVKQAGQNESPPMNSSPKTL